MTNDCCMAEHAKAIPPWTCKCPCHQKKDEGVSSEIRVFLDSIVSLAYSAKDEDVSQLGETLELIQGDIDALNRILSQQTNHD